MSLRRMLLAIAFCALGGIAGPAQASWYYQRPVLENNVVATNGVLTDTPWYAISYSTDGTRPMCEVVRTTRFRLFYPRTFVADRSIDKVVKTLEEGFSRTEELLGKINGPLDVYIALQIKPKSNPCDKNVFTGGLAFRSGVNVIVIAKDYLNVGVCAHEALHIRLRELGRSPPGWFEEGMAAYVESADGFHQWHFDNLGRNSPLALEQMAHLKPCTDKDLRARSTAWLLVYYCVHVEKMKFTDLAALAEFADPVRAYGAVREYYAQSNTSKK